MIGIIAHKPPEDCDLVVNILYNNENISSGIAKIMHKMYLDEGAIHPDDIEFQSGRMYMFNNGLWFREHDNGSGSPVNRRFTLEFLVVDQVDTQKTGIISTIPALLKEAMVKMSISLRDGEMERELAELKKTIDKPRAEGRVH
jgi:hypothetical protein